VHAARGGRNLRRDLRGGNVTQKQTRRAKVALTVVVIVLGLLSVANTYTFGWRPVIGAKARELSARKFDATGARLERGRYLVEGPLHCFACHSPRDPNSQVNAPLAEKKGAGKVFSDGKFGLLVAPNITPDAETGAGLWTDDMIARAVREGIGHDGRALFPMMPYRNLGGLSDEDLASVVVYLRSIPAVRNPLPQTKLSFPFNLLVKGEPAPVYAPVAQPDANNPVERGAYLARVANCATCHSPLDGKGHTVAGMEFAGGSKLRNAQGRELVTPNLTPDPSGISYYDEEMFVKAMRTGQVGARRLDPEMPWGYFRNMTDEDLRAIFAYLRTVKPVKLRVKENWEIAEQ
jgi:mono/diheme cytochrome c family protein